MAQARAGDRHAVSQHEPGGGDGLRSFGARRIAVAHRLCHEVNAGLAKAFLIAQGFEVVGARGVGLSAREPTTKREAEYALGSKVRRGAGGRVIADFLRRPAQRWASQAVGSARYPVVGENAGGVGRRAALGESGPRRLADGAAPRAIPSRPCTKRFVPKLRCGRSSSAQWGRVTACCAFVDFRAYRCLQDPMKATRHRTLKSGSPIPWAAIEGALNAGIEGVASVRQGKGLRYESRGAIAKGAARFKQAGDKLPRQYAERELSGRGERDRSNGRYVVAWHGGRVGRAHHEVGVRPGNGRCGKARRWSASGKWP